MDEYGFNPAAYMYYYPELTRDQGVVTVEDARDYYLGPDPDRPADPGARYADLVDLGLNGTGRTFRYTYSNVFSNSQSNWTVTRYVAYSNLFPKPDFNGKLFLLQNSSIADMSRLNATITTALVTLGYNLADVLRRGSYLEFIRAPVIYTGCVDGVYAFTYHAVYKDFITLNTLNAGDRVLILKDGNQSMYGHVGTLDYAARKFTLVNVPVPYVAGASYTLLGIHVADVEQLGRINYIRLILGRLKAQRPLSDSSMDESINTSGWDPNFNTDLYQMLYPDAKNLSKEQCYLDYLTRLSQGKARIGYTEDIATYGSAAFGMQVKSLQVNKDLAVAGNADFSGPEVLIEHTLAIGELGRITLPPDALMDVAEGSGQLVCHAQRLLLSNDPSTNVDLCLSHASNDRGFLSLVGETGYLLPEASNGCLAIAAADGNAILMGLEDTPYTLRVDASAVTVHGDVMTAKPADQNVAWQLAQDAGNEDDSVLRRACATLVSDADHMLLGASNGSFALTASPGDAVLVGVEGRPFTLAVEDGLAVVQGRLEAHEYYTVSDRRLKEDVRVLPDALATLSKLRGYSFVLRRPHEGRERSRQVGLLAQEVQAVVPELVQRDAEGMLSLAYGNMAGLFVEAIRALDARVSQLESQVKPS